MLLHQDVPISVPTPRTLPPKAMRALSPPELYSPKQLQSLDHYEATYLPPEVKFLLRGLTVRPKVLFTLSAIIIAVGTLVLTYKTAPAFLSKSTSVVLYVAGELAHDTNPTVESLPMMLKLSFRLMGSPCSGPIGTPVDLM